MTAAIEFGKIALPRVAAPLSVCRSVPCAGHSSLPHAQDPWHTEGTATVLQDKGALRRIVSQERQQGPGEVRHGSFLQTREQRETRKLLAPISPIPLNSRGLQGVEEELFVLTTQKLRGQ